MTYDNWGRYQGYKFKIMDVTVNDHYYWEYEMDGIPTMDEVKKEIDMASIDNPNNVLKNAPHTLDMLTADTWDFPYTRETAAFPLD